MAKLSFMQANEIANRPKANYFALKENGAKATVRFLYNSMDDIEVDSIHEVPNGQYTTKVSCLGSDCPLCKAGDKSKLKFYIPLYNETTKRSEIWERGFKFRTDLRSLFEDMEEPFCSTPVTITRYGEKGDTGTTYKMKERDKDRDSKKLSDFEMPTVLGSVVREWSADEMNAFLNPPEIKPRDNDKPY